MNAWYQMEGQEVLDKLGTTQQVGLLEKDIMRLLAHYGPNTLVENTSRGPLRIFWEQLTSTMVLVLIGAAAISWFLGDIKDTVAILVIVALNAILGFFQEYRAEKAMAALRKMSLPMVRVRRLGRTLEIPSRDLVPGDIVLMEAGNVVPADCRLLESFSLKIEEAALTGESETVDKTVEKLDGYELPLGDRTNMVYMGTIITSGRAVAVVTATGMNSELGKIANMMQSVQHTQTPLQKRLDSLSKVLAVVALVLVGVIFILGLYQGEDIKLMLMTALSMAVAAVPEGLPAVVTIALALGAQHMLKKQALIRKLPAVETLGSVTVICSDKTGTLTQNKMHVEELKLPKPERSNVMQSFDTGKGLAENLLLVGGALCNDAEYGNSLTEETESTRSVEGGAILSTSIVGDPTEKALLEIALQGGLPKNELIKVLPRITEVPFDSDRKRMSTVHRWFIDDELPEGLQSLKQIAGIEADILYLTITKGAVDSILPICSAILVEERIFAITEDWRKWILQENDDLAQKGMRVLGLAVKLSTDLPDVKAPVTVEQGIVFVGMFGMIDPPRVEVKEAVEVCLNAGIRPVMITGDHPVTAREIARQLGIYQGGKILTGQDLAALSIAQLEEVVAEVSVYARVSPEHKLNIVQALQNRGHIVAMTGDGVNDAPALKKADIGVAMGITGTDVAKEAADMVLQDDNFATIVTAIQEGRVIYDNIKKFVLYILASNAGEIWVMILAFMVGMPLPLTPLQVLWINLITDGLPALALAVEPAEQNTMKRPPERPKSGILNKEAVLYILLMGLLMGGIALALGYWFWREGNNTWQTMVFTTLTLTQLGQVLALRSQRESLFSLGLFSNKFMLLAVGSGLALQMAIIYVPIFQEVFSTASLKPMHLLFSLAAAACIFGIVELLKLIKRSCIFAKSNEIR